MKTLKFRLNLKNWNSKVLPLGLFYSETGYATAVVKLGRKWAHVRYRGGRYITRSYRCMKIPLEDWNAINKTEIQ